MWWYEFNRTNYPKAYFDNKLKNNIYSYALDTNVILHGDKELKEFLNKGAKVTLYPVTLCEIFFNKKFRKNKEKYKKLLNRENVRMVNYGMTHYEQEFIKEIEQGIIQRNDALFLTYAKLEGSCIISFDKGVNEVAFRHDLKLWDTRVMKRFPKKGEIKFKGSWKKFTQQKFSENYARI